MNNVIRNIAAATVLSSLMAGGAFANEALTEAARKSLEKAMINGNVNVVVDGTTATLTGIADDRSQIEKALRAVRNVEGITDVRDDISAE